MKKFFLIGMIVFLGNIQLAANEHELVFTSIYKTGKWGRNKQGEGRSGWGSILENCISYVALLEKFIEDHNIQTVVDAGCGDWEFSRHVNWHGASYIGYDVVGHVIEKNIKKYANENVIFVHKNFLDEDLPHADLLLCKHVLQHLTNEDIVKFCSQFRKFKYCLITNEVDPNTLTSDGTGSEVGGMHKVDLSKPPFNVKGTPVLNYRTYRKYVHQVYLIDNTQA